MTIKWVQEPNAQIELGSEINMFMKLRVFKKKLPTRMFVNKSFNP